MHSALPLGKPICSNLLKKEIFSRHRLLCAFTLMADPTALLFTTLNSIKKIIDYGFQLKDVSVESRAAQECLRVVQSDLKELARLILELEDTITPKEQRSIDDVVCRTNEVIALMAAPNRRSRKDVKEFGTVTIPQRIMWTLRDGDAIKKHHPTLLVCQVSLNGQLTSMRMKRAAQAALGRGAHGMRLNVEEDESSLSLAPRR